MVVGNYVNTRNLSVFQSTWPHPPWNDQVHFPAGNLSRDPGRSESNEGVFARTRPKDRRFEAGL